jgi:hypothetical protein
MGRGVIGLGNRSAIATIRTLGAEIKIAQLPTGGSAS